MRNKFGNNNCTVTDVSYLQSNFQVKSRWDEFMTRLKKKGGSEGGNEASDVKEYFPFHVYFSNAPQPIFKG